MTEGIKPCPFCGSDAVQLVLSFSSWFVRCNECDATSPSEDDTSDGDRKAIDSWNVPERKSQLSGVVHFCEITGDVQPAYMDGHKRARHEAAEIANEADTEIDRLRAALEWIADNGPDDAWELREKARSALKHIGKGEL